MKSVANCYIYQAACGQAHSLMIARNEDDKDKKALEEITAYDPVSCP